MDRNWRNLSIPKRKALLEQLFASKGWNNDRKRKIGGTIKGLVRIASVDNLPPVVWQKLFFSSTETGFSTYEQRRVVRAIIKFATS